MKQFIEPQSVALIGVSRHTGEGAFNILENLLSYGYQGRIYPINPSVSEILGVKTFPSVTKITDNIDLAIIATPRSLVPQLLKECTESNIKSAVIVAQGFSDANDEESKQLQKELTDIVKDRQTRIVGPNTFGTANVFTNFSSSFVKIRMKKQPTGIICQTGVFFIGFPEMTFVGKGVDLGNACDISFADSLEYFANDSETKVVAMHIEGMQNAKSFVDICKRIAPKKAILALKTVKSEQAAKAAQSHTGSLAGKKEVWEAALKQSGVIQVADLEELIDLTRTFSMLPFMETSKIGVITITGGLGVMALDACQNSDIKIDKLSSSTKGLLDAMSPSWLNIGNPVDIWPAMMTSQPPIKPLIDGLKVLLSDPQIGAVLFIGAAFDEKWGAGLYQLLNELAATYQDKPLACCIYGPYANETIKELQDAGKVVGFPTPERAIRALSRLNKYSQLRRRL
jgi:acetyltransferase